MTISRKYGTLTESTLSLQGVPRLFCRVKPVKPGPATPHVEFGDPLAPAGAHAVYATQPDRIEDTIAWAEDFITMLKELQ